MKSTQFAMIHVPRCAGTSMAEVLGGATGQTCRPMSDAELRCAQTWPVAVVAHSTYGYLRRQFRDSVLVLVTRDPVERLVSWIRYMRTRYRRSLCGRDHFANPHVAAACQWMSTANFREILLSRNELIYKNLNNRYVRQLSTQLRLPLSELTESDVVKAERNLRSDVSLIEYSTMDRDLKHFLARHGLASQPIPRLNESDSLTEIELEEWLEAQHYVTRHVELDLRVLSSVRGLTWDQTE